MQKALVVGLGGQGQKYLNYFIKNNFEVYGICKTQAKKLQIKSKFNIEISTDYKDFSQINFAYIIIAVPPEIQGEIAIEIAKTYPNSKIIVEIPVTFDEKCLVEIMKYENISFFIEEYYTLLSQFIRKIKLGMIEKINVTIHINDEESENINAIRVAHIHLLNNFYQTDLDFDKLIIKIEYHDSEDIYYEVSFLYLGKPINYTFGKEDIKLVVGENRFSDNYHFDSVLKKILDGDTIGKKPYLKMFNYIR